MKPILQIQQVSKSYRLQHEGQRYLSLRDSLASLFRKSTATRETFWALKDISLDVMPGDAIGIIGKNGAGKSTLLKILSRITPPTSGKITVRGRVASLLEVGTGFHPELTGSENVFLNGSILGMKRAEIKSRFDEIIAFSGTERFLDTPLKHYSSGMQLRLAFAVAAFLEPEILIIDEVLAVGDSEFQKKCIGKMEDISRSGRTLLFVSHNIGAVHQLCRSAILLEAGQLKAAGTTTEVTRAYLESGSESRSYSFSGNKESGIYFTKIELRNAENNPAREFMHGDTIFIHATVAIDRYVRGAWLCFAVLDKLKFRVFSLIKPLDEFYNGESGLTIRVAIRNTILAANHYSFLAAVYFPGGGHLDWIEDICPITINDPGTELAPYPDHGTVIIRNAEWSKV